MKEKIKLIIFDWDGTLMNSQAKIVRCFQKAYKDVGLEIPEPDQISEVIGLGMKEAVQTLLPEGAEPDHMALIESYREHFLFKDKTPMEFFPAVLNGLQQLRDWGYWLAVATGKARRGLNRILDQKQLHHLFVATRCSDESGSKPNPQMLVDLLEQTNLVHYEAVMIGDSVYDMEMAKNLGMARMAVSYGVHQSDRLMPYQPVQCFDDFQQLLDWFDPNDSAR